MHALDDFKDPIHLFIDTEFTKLHPLEKKLISVGMCADYSTVENGVNSSWMMYYAELTDTYELKDCSDFVKKNVLPLLCHKEEHRVTKHKLILDMCAWIEELPRDVILVSDAPSWDFTFFTDMLEDSSIRPKNLIALASFTAGPNMPVEINYAREHHAMDDAWINLLWAKQNKAVGDDGIKVLRSFAIQPS